MSKYPGFKSIVCVFVAAGTCLPSRCSETVVVWSPSLATGLYAPVLAYIKNRNTRNNLAQHSEKGEPHPIRGRIINHTPKGGCSLDSGEIILFCSRTGPSLDVDHIRDGIQDSYPELFNIRSYSTDCNEIWR
jgi:hypothetical protein